jgi:uncharacterized membrane protein YdjX (TVP38/TMEM64 family)
VNLRRAVLLPLWLCVMAGGLLFWMTHRDVFHRQIGDAFSASVLVGYGFYLLLGCLRGFTLIPSTTLVLAAVAFLSPVPLFLLTLLGILVSSANVYWFSEMLDLKDVFERTHKARVAQLEGILRKYELPIIIGWSFFPVAPTDLIVYVCGVLEIDFAKCLLGVCIGEGAICAAYIFAGDYLLHVLHLK